MPVAGSLVVNTDGSAWYSGPPDPTTFQQASAVRGWIYDGSVWKEALGVFIFDGTSWVPVIPPQLPTITSSDTSFCTSTTPTYQVGNTVTNVPAGATWEVRGFKSTTGDSGYTQATPSFTVAEGDSGTCWGYYQIRVKSNYSGWSSWSGDSNHVHLPVHACGRPL